MADINDPFKPAESGGIVDPFKASAVRPTATPEPAKPKLKRTWGEVASDSAIGVAQGAVNLVGGTASLVERVSLLNPLRDAGAHFGLLERGGTTVAADATSAANEYLGEKLSPVLKRKKQELAETKGFLPSAKKVVTDPALAGQFLAEQVPNLATLGYGTVATGARAAAAARPAALATRQATLTRGGSMAEANAAGKEIVETARKKAGTRFLTGAGTTVESGNSYVQARDEALNAPEETWQANPAYTRLVAGGMDPNEAKRVIANEVGLAAAAVTAPLAAVGARVSAPFETSIFNRAVNPAGVRGLFTPAGAAKVAQGAAAEAAEETVQEGGAQFGTNVGLRQLDPNQALMEGVPEAAGTGAGVGFLLGGGLGAGGVTVSRGQQPTLRRQPPQATPTPEQPAPAAQDAAGAVPDAVQAQTAPQVPEQADVAAQEAQPATEDLFEAQLPGEGSSGIPNSPGAAIPPPAAVPFPDAPAGSLQAAFNVMDPDAPAQVAAVAAAAEAQKQAGKKKPDEKPKPQADNPALGAPPPWVNPETGEFTPPSDDMLAREIRTRIELMSAAGKGILPLTKETAQAWGVELPRLRAIRKRVLDQRKSMDDALDRARRERDATEQPGQAATDTAPAPSAEGIPDVIEPGNGSPDAQVAMVGDRGEPQPGQADVPGAGGNVGAQPADTAEGAAGGVEQAAQTPLGLEVERLVAGLSPAERAEFEARTRAAPTTRRVAIPYRDGDREVEAIEVDGRLVFKNGDAWDVLNAENRPVMVRGETPQDAVRLATQKDQRSAAAAQEKQRLATAPRAEQIMAAFEDHPEKAINQLTDDEVLALAKASGKRFAKTAKVANIRGRLSSGARTDVQEALRGPLQKVLAASTPSQETTGNGRNGSVRGVEAAAPAGTGQPDGSQADAGGTAGRSPGDAGEPVAAVREDMAGAGAAAEPQAALTEQETDRRANEAERARIDALPADERDAEIQRLRARVQELEQGALTNPLTGLPNKAAFEADEALGWPAVVAIDMDGLKRLNDTVGHENADAVLRALGRELDALASDTARFYHRSGDEFAARFKNKAEAETVMAELQSDLEGLKAMLVVEVAGQPAQEYEYRGIGISYGLGANYEAADLAANEQKRERLAAGIREDARADGPPRRLRQAAADPEGREGDADGAAAAAEEVAPPAAIEAAAAEAATSPTNDRPAPSEGQIEAGNYKKGHVRLHGLDITIENPAGTRRRPEWPPLAHHYGYLKRTNGADGEHVDVFVGDNAGDASLPVFVVNQVNRDGKFDEHKVILGQSDEDAARKAYLDNYSKGWTGLGSIRGMSLDEFKAWLRDGDTEKPAPVLTPTVRMAKGKPAFILDEKTLAAYFQPGRIVDAYIGQDRVLGFNWNDGNWSVRVINVDEDGSPKAGERERTHSTAPSAKELRKVLGDPAQFVKARKAPAEKPAPTPSKPVTFADFNGALKQAKDALQRRLDAMKGPAFREQAKKFLAPWGVKAQGNRAAVTQQVLDTLDTGNPSALREFGVEVPASIITALEAKFEARLVEKAPVTPDPVPEPAKSPDPAPTAPAQTTNTEDSGAELWYNRRNRTGSGLQWSDLEDLNATLKAKEAVKSKVWPRPDYEALVADGMHPVLARLLKQVYDGLAAKPKVYGAATDEQLREYVETIGKVRDTMFAALQKVDAKAMGPMLVEGRGPDLVEMINQTGLPNLEAAIFPGDARNRYGSGNPDNNRRALLIGGNKTIKNLRITIYDLRAAAKDVEAGWPTPREAWERMFVIRESKAGSKVYRGGKEEVLAADEFYVVKKGQRRIVAEGLPTRAAAIDKARELASQNRKKGETLAEEAIDLEQAVRTGAARRGADEDITSDRLRETFGFKGVNFGNWMKGDSPAKRRERQLHLNHAYDSFADLAELLNVPSKALSLNGMLGLAIGAQGNGRGSGAAHFVPGVNEINLTRAAGVGSLAHEWGHAMDHYFAVQAGDRFAKQEMPFITHAIADGIASGTELRPEVLEAFRSLHTTMTKRAMTPAEMAARAEQREAIALRRVNSWITPVRTELERRAKPADKDRVLAEFDALAERIRAGDLGDGYVPARNARGGLRPVLADLRNLVKDATGRVPSKSDFEGLAINAEARAYAVANTSDAAEHVPQMAASNYAIEAMKLDNDKRAFGGGNYWKLPTEMLARAFQSYALDRLAERQARNDYLTRPQMDEATFKVAQEMGLAEDGDRYPRGDERKAINEAFDTLMGTLRTREDEAGNVALFSQPAAAAEATPNQARVRGWIAPVTSTWGEAQPRVEVVATGEGLPARAKTGQGYKTADGYYDDSTGTVYLIADKLPTQRDALRVLAHESVGHYGVEAITGPALWDQLTNTIARMRGNKKHAVLFAEVDRRYKGANAAIALRETLAVMAEKGVRNSVMDRAIAAIRNFIRQTLGIDLRFTEAELRQHLVAAARYVRDGRRPREAAAPEAMAEPAFSKGTRSAFTDAMTFAGTVRAFLDGKLPKDRAIHVTAGTPDVLVKLGAPDVPIVMAPGTLTKFKFAGGDLHPEITQGMMTTLVRHLHEPVAVFDSATEPGALVVMTEVDADGKRVMASLHVRASSERMVVNRVTSLYGRERREDFVRWAREGKLRYLDRTRVPAWLTTAGLQLPGVGPATTGTGRRVLLETDVIKPFSSGSGAYSVLSDPFYSSLVESVQAARGAPKKGDAAAWKGWLDGAQRRGEFRQSERDWLGLDAWLEGRETTTRAELADFVRANQVQVNDVVLSDARDVPPDISDELNSWIGEQVDNELLGEDGINFGDIAAQLHEMADDYLADGEPTESETYRRMATEALRIARGDKNPGVAKFADYQLPGGQNYRELLLTLPTKDFGGDPVATMTRQELADWYEREVGYNPLDDDPDMSTPALREQVREYAVESDMENIPTAGALDNSAFRSGHFDQPNILAHVRFNERTDAEGKRVLFIEEVQSDWHQEGRKKGYAVGDFAEQPMKATINNSASDPYWEVRTEAGTFVANVVNLDPATSTPEQAISEARRLARARNTDRRVPDAPFKATDEWAMLAFKRMARWAVDNGFDRIAWTTGEQQAERYDLSKKIGILTVSYASDNRYIVGAFGPNGGELPGMTRRTMMESELEGFVGKELAEKIIKREGGTLDERTGGRSYSGLDLKVGGEGMRAFYDKILPSAVNKWAKKFGGKVGTTQVVPSSMLPHNTTRQPVSVHSLDLTDAMRDTVRAGQPLFSQPPDQVLADLEAVMAAGRDDSVLERARARLANLTPKKVKDALRGTWLGALGTNHLTELGSDYFDGMRHYTDFLKSMEADRNTLMAEGEELAEKARKWASKNKPMARRLFDLMHSATIDGVDPAKQYQVLQFRYGGKLHDATRKNVADAIKEIRQQMRERSGDSKQNMLDRIKTLQAMLSAEQRRAKQYGGLVARWNELSPEAQELYKDFRDTYAARSDAVEEALVQRIEDLKGDGVTDGQRRALVAKIREQFETNRLQGVYFPLQRFGRYFVAAEKGDTNTFLMYESLNEAERAEKDLKARGWKITSRGKRIDQKAENAPSGTFVAEVITELRKANISEKTQDSIYQLYLNALPELSMRKHQIHRKAVPGFDPDAVRAFGWHMQHGSHQLAKLRYMHKLEGVLKLLETQQKEARKAPDADVRAIAAGDAILEELNKRHDWIANPMDSGLTNLVSSFGFTYYLGITPAAALVNLSQTAIVTFPVLAARHGPAKAMNALLAAGRDSMRTVGNIDKTLTDPEEVKAYQALKASGAIDKTQAHNLAGIADGGLQGYSPAWAKTMEVIGWAFHKAEVVNREASAMAAFRLARQEGMEFDAAVRHAHDVVIESHFDYSNANRARFMQSGTAKVLLMFRQYSLNITWFLARNTWQATKGMDPETKKMARRKLAGVLGMTSLFSGTLGLPLMSVAFGVLNAAAATFGDDDEPFSAETEFKNFLADMLGPDAARIVASGVANEVTGADIASRVSLSQLWFRDADRELEGRGMYYHLLEQAAGPMGGVLKNVLVGKQQIDEGNVWRGVETMLPKALKDTMKGARYSIEGVNNFRGDPLVEDVSLWQALLQMQGFTPAQVARQYDANSAVKGYEQHILNRRQHLTDAYAMAWRLGDSEAQSEVLEKMRAFNRTNPELAISAETLRRSLKSRMRYSQRAEDGIIVNPKLEARVRGAVRFNAEG